MWWNANYATKQLCGPFQTKQVSDPLRFQKLTLCRSKPWKDVKDLQSYKIQNLLGSQNSGERRHLRMYPLCAWSLWSGSKLVIVCKREHNLSNGQRNKHQGQNVALTLQESRIPGSLLINAKHNKSHDYWQPPPNSHPTLQSKILLLYPPLEPEFYKQESSKEHHSSLRDRCEIMFAAEHQHYVECISECSKH